MTRALDRRCRSRRRAARGLVAALAVACCAAGAQSAWASAPLTFSAPATVTGAALGGVSCAGESLCVAVDGEGAAFVTSNPKVASPAYTRVAIDPGQQLDAISCVAPGTCVAADRAGNLLASSDPAVAGSWTAPRRVGEAALTGVSCPSASLCVAVAENGEAFTSTGPVGGVWKSAQIDGGRRLTAASCASESLCVAVDAAGNVLSTVTPKTGGSWQSHAVSGTELLAVSCSAGAVCVAADSVGDVFASQNAASPTPTWSLTPIDSGARIQGVSCASSGLCVAVDARGLAFASDGPTAPLPSWRESTADPGRSLTGIACAPGGFCLAVDREGRSVLGRVPAPEATTTVPTIVRSTSATLAGVVSPNDAVLGACFFEYGTGVPYASSVPCSVLPVPAGGAQSVSAEVGSLAPNTPYHYRLVASDPEGASAGLDEAFVTAVSSEVALVFPHPSITGTPAVSQKLTCHAGTQSGAEAQLSYAWLRDLIPIAGATGSTYTVKGQDSGHHLQCQVTATDAGGSATAKSAFVTIPQGGVPASAGETFVGRAQFSKGRVSVPITCSSNAFSGCHVSVRVTVVEALAGRRVVGVSARAPRGSAEASLRHATVTVASASTRVARGARHTVTATLNSTGRRLVAAKRRFAATLSVSGTVIGVIESTLAHQTVVLSASKHAARGH